MFSNIKGLFHSALSARDNDYIPASTLIKEGSVLDRRKKRNERRTNADRRVGLSKIVSTLDRRKQGERRRNNDRRCTQGDRQKKEINAGETTLSVVNTLIAEQQALSKITKKMIVSAELMNYKVLNKRIKKLNLAVKAHLCREEDTLHCYLEAVTKGSNKEYDDCLKTLSRYIFTPGEELIEKLSQYTKSNVDSGSVSQFLLDMYRISDILDEALIQKNEHLYSLYRQIPDKYLIDSLDK